MKWFKRLLFSAVVLLVIVLIAVGVGIYMSRGTPSWYKPKTYTAQQQHDFANQAVQKIFGVKTWVASVQARMTRESRGNATTEPPIKPFTLVLSEDEINSFFRQRGNPAADQMRALLGRYFTDGRLILTDHHEMILAGQSRDMGSLVSVQLEPSVDDKGQLWLVISGFTIGRLPVPQAMVSDKLDKLKASLVSDLATSQASAAIDTHGVANRTATTAAMTRLLLNALDGEPSAPVIFIPFDLSHTEDSFPVQVTDIVVSEGSISMTLSPLSEKDRETLLEKIKKPYGADAVAEQQ